MTNVVEKNSIVFNLAFRRVVVFIMERGELGVPPGIPIMSVISDFFGADV